MDNKFQHKGIEIELTSYGEFMAVINGRNVRKPSLKAMKEAIDKAAKTAFEPFKVLIETTWKFQTEKKIPGTDLIRVEAISIEKNTARYSRKSQSFVVKGKNETANMENLPVYQDSAEAIEAYKALSDHEEETRRIKNERQEQEEKLCEALKKFEIDPDDYAKK